MTTQAEKIRTAVNASQVNALLPDEMAIVNSGRRLWTITEYGNAKGFPEPFDDARQRAADLYDAADWLFDE